MPRKKENFAKCVYKIFFKNCIKIYIGSTCRWPYRKTEHLTSLKKQKHSNKYLQRSFNKYGEAFIESLEFCEESILRNREQYWIDFFDSTNPEKGFNLVKLANQTGTIGYKFTAEQKENSSKITKARMSDKQEREKISKTIAEKILQNPKAFGGKFIAKTFNLLSPDGEIIQIINLCKYCRENNLNYKLMHEVANKKRTEYNGWRNPTNKIKSYSFVNPSGDVITTENLSELCRKENLENHTMSAIHRGIGLSCQGWRKYNENGITNHHKGKDFSLINKNGEIKNGNNLKNFCKENKINFESLRKGCWSGGWKKKN